MTGPGRIVCDECTRAEALRAVAGRGLPAIEPGMPVPAGTGLTRRGFVVRSAGLALAVYGAGRLGLFDEGIAAAAAQRSSKILVTVFMGGGADSLSLLYPEGDPLYHQLRPTLAVDGGTQFSEDARLYWHPGLAPLAQLHAEGKVTVFPSIGYDHPDQSHFTSRHFWEVGATDTRLLTGWLGRYLDAAGTNDNPLQGLSLTGSLSPALATARVPVAAIDGPGQYDFWVPGVWGTVETRMLDALGALGSVRSSDPSFRTAARVTAQSSTLRRQLEPFAKDPPTKPATPYPTGDSFPQQLAGVAAMIGAGLPLRCVALDASGAYDTHAGQVAALDPALQMTGASLYAFQRDLEERGVADRVLTLVWSEFGRRAKENGSGTDHGAAGTAFLIGTRAAGTQVGEFPGLANGLDDDGNLKPTADFRGVYGALLEQWLSFDAARVIPDAKKFQRPTLVK
ncbi:MAG TPA: DUF1501 domain-containing protein [Gaiellaceae bacterium]|nr:DUF1501 domain-containing protein [Gaiellaceae bacterium]